MKPSSIHKFSHYIALTWLSAIFTAWLVFQASELASSSIPADLHVLRSILAAVLLFTASSGTGMVLCACLKEHPTLRMFCAPLLGLISISTLTLAGGLLHLIPDTITAWLLLLGLNAVFLSKIAAWFRILKNTWIHLFAQTRSRLVRILRAVVILLILTALLIALAPPTQWDSLMYHLSAGRFYIDHGGIVTSPDNYRFSNPALMTMLFMLLQVLAGPSAPALLNWFLGLWVLAGIAVFFIFLDENQHANLKKTWFASALLFSGSSFTLAMTRSYADMILLPLTLASVMLLLPGTNLTTRKRILAGIFCGALVSIKYTAFPFCIGIGLLALFSGGPSWKIRFRALLWTTLAAVITFLPWLLKNWFLDGNPIAPYLWGSPAFDAYDMAHTLPTPHGNPLLNLLTLPLQAAVYGSEHLDPFQGSVGPVLIGLFPAAFIFWKRLPSPSRTILKALLIVIIPAYLTWTIGASFSQNLAIIRFYLPMFMLMALIITIWQADLPKNTGVIPWKKIATSLVLFALLLGTAKSVYRLAHSRPLPVILGLQDQGSYLDSLLGHYHTLSTEIHSLAEENPDTNVLMLWEPRTYYCQPVCIGDDNLNTWQKSFAIEGSGEAVMESWGRQGYTHVFISHRGAEFLLGQELDRIPQLTNYDELLALIPDGLQPLKIYDDYGLYTLTGFH